MAKLKYPPETYNYADIPGDVNPENLKRLEATRSPAAQAAVAKRQAELAKRKQKRAA